MYDNLQETPIGYSIDFGNLINKFTKVVTLVLIGHSMSIVDIPRWFLKRFETELRHPGVTAKMNWNQSLSTWRHFQYKLKLKPVELTSNTR